MKITFSDILGILKRGDALLFGLCLAASVFGIVIISSATASYHSASYLTVQIASLLLGMILFFLFTIIDIDVIVAQWPVLLVTEIVLLLLLIPFGVSGGTGNTSWIRFFGIGIQPSEVVKVIYIVLAARHTANLKEKNRLDAPLSIVQLGAHFGMLFLMLLVISDDLGNALIFFFIFVVMLFAAGLKLYWFLFGAAAMALVIPLAWNSFLTERQKARILGPYDSSVDPDGYGVNWEPSQAKMALSSGRLTGEGLYSGTQTQSDYGLASKHADYIFASAGEELGMLGCLIIILLLTAIIIRCVYVGLHSRNTFCMLVCVGVASSMFFQTFENTGMCLGLTPVIGVALPFFSYGGSSLFTTFAAMGLVSGIHYKTNPVHRSPSAGGGIALFLQTR